MNAFPNFQYVCDVPAGTRMKRGEDGQLFFRPPNGEPFTLQFDISVCPAVARKVPLNHQGG